MNPIRPSTALLLTALSFAVRTAAQPAAAAASVAGMVQSQSGRPVAGARVVYRPDPDIGIPWLRAHLSAPAPGTGQSDPRGRFRIAAPDGQGCLWIEHEDGLGAVRPHYATGSAERITAEPLGALRLRDGRAFVAHPRVLRDDRGLVAIERREGAEIRLPAADYVILIEVAAAASPRQRCLGLVRVAIRSGEVQEIAVPKGRGPGLPVPATGRATLPHWPEVALPRDGDEDLVRLPEVDGYGVAECSIDVEGTRWFEEVWYSAEARTVAWPFDPAARQNATTLRIRAAGLDAARADAFLWVDRGTPRVIARSAFDERSTAAVAVPRSAGGSALGVVIVANGRPPAVATVPSGGVDELRIDVPEPASCVLRVLSPSGDPVAFAGVELHAGDAVPRVFVTDAGGRVRLTFARGAPPRLRIEHAAFLPFEGPLELSAVALDRPAESVVELDSGLELFGIAFLDRERPARDVRIELRDPTDATGIETRTVVTDAAGRFRFRGLPDGVYTLFGQSERDGVTWSGKLPRIQPGDHEWRLDLRREDPPLPRRKR